VITSTSFFDSKAVCIQCAEDERSAPGYAVAKATEQAEVNKGNLNFI